MSDKKDHVFFNSMVQLLVHVLSTFSKYFSSVKISALMLYTSLFSFLAKVNVIEFCFSFASAELFLPDGQINFIVAMIS